VRPFRRLGDQGLHHALHALKREPLTSAAVFATISRVAAGDQLIDAGEVPRALPESLDRRAAQLARDVQAVDAALARVATDFAVEFDAALRPTSPMSPKSRNFVPDLRGEHIDRGAYRIGIGVKLSSISVAPNGCEPLNASAAGRKTASPARRGWPRLRFKRARRRRAGVE